MCECRSSTAFLSREAAAIGAGRDAEMAQEGAAQVVVVAETGASVDIPSSIFTEDAGKPEDAYGKQFLTSDGRANLTIESPTK